MTRSRSRLVMVLFFLFSLFPFLSPYFTVLYVSSLPSGSRFSSVYLPLVHSPLVRRVPSLICNREIFSHFHTPLKANQAWKGNVKMPPGKMSPEKKRRAREKQVTKMSTKLDSFFTFPSVSSPSRLFELWPALPLSRPSPARWKGTEWQISFRAQNSQPACRSTPFRQPGAAPSPYVAPSLRQ